MTEILFSKNYALPAASPTTRRLACIIGPSEARERGGQITDRLFREWTNSNFPCAVEMRANLHELRGKDLLCWCPVGGPCHGDVLLEMAIG